MKNMPKEGICYLFSTAALKNWKEYVDYDNMIKNSKVINLKHQKKPEKINEDLINMDKDNLPYPDKDQPCSIILKDGIIKDKDFILVGQELWEYFEKKYTGTPIKRNFAKVGQNDIIFTNELRIVYYFHYCLILLDQHYFCV